LSLDSKLKRLLDQAEIERIIALNREDMDRLAPSYREEKFRTWHLPYLLREVEQVVATLDGIEAPRVLTVGCGVGLVTPLVMERIDGTATAIDVSGKALELFEESLPDRVRGRVRIEEIDAESYLSKTNETYHLVIYSGVLHHIPNYLDVLELSCNVIEPGGVIFITKEPAPLVEQGRFGQWLRFVDGNINRQKSLLKGSVEESLRYNRRYLRKLLPKRSRLYGQIDEEVRQGDMLHNEAEYHSEIDRPAVLDLLRDAGFDIVANGAAQPVFNFHLSQALSDAMAAKVNTLLSFMVIAKRRYSP
jgi:SAM-dependent methyltransferase